MTLAEFTERWQRFVRHWARGEKKEAGSRALVQDLLARGLAAVTDGLPVDESAGAQPAPSEQVSLRCELAVIRHSTLFDAKAYRRANAEVRSGRLDPAEHFCVAGWCLLRNPSLGFDVWWYWSEYLDPSADEVNPLLHYLLVGR